METKNPETKNVKQTATKKWPLWKKIIVGVGIFAFLSGVYNVLVSSGSIKPISLNNQTSCSSFDTQRLVYALIYENAIGEDGTENKISNASSPKILSKLISETMPGIIQSSVMFETLQGKSNVCNVVFDTQKGDEMVASYKYKIFVASNGQQSIDVTDFNMSKNG